MTLPGAPVIEFRSVEKALGESFPLRVKAFTLRRHERVILAGLPGPMGEAFMNLIIGALLPDQGDVIVFGKNTRDIRTDTEWLTSLDRFGLVTNRAVLLDQSTVAQNLALPLTLAIDPMSPETRTKVEALAREVDLPIDALDRPLGTSMSSRIQMHLARALAHEPQVLLVEHPTLVSGSPRYELGARLRTIVDQRQLTLLAVSDDRLFARETGAQRLQVSREGVVRSAGFALNWGFRRRQ